MKIRIAIITLLALSCSSGGSNPPRTGDYDTWVDMDSGCGIVRWYPGQCLDRVSSDKLQVKFRLEASCAMFPTGNLTGWSVVGKSDPQANGKDANGTLNYDRDEVYYRCEYPEVVQHEITCHIFMMGKACKSPH